MGCHIFLVIIGSAGDEVIDAIWFNLVHVEGNQSEECVQVSDPFVEFLSERITT